MNSNSQSTSPSLILDLVSKFLTKALEKDRNSSFYLKQWESFKLLLSANPLDLGPVFSYIATMTSKSPQISREGSPLLNKPPVKLRPTTNIDTYTHIRNRSFNIVSEVDTHNSFNVLETRSQEEGENSYTRKRIYSGADLHPGSPVNVEIRKHQSYKPSGFAHNGSGVESADGITKLGAPFRLEDELKSHSAHTYSYNTSNLASPYLDVPSAQPLQSQTTSIKPYSLSYISALARNLKDNFQKNTEKLLTKHEGVKEAEIYGHFEPRSPLRKLKVYEKKDEYPSQGLMDKVRGLAEYKLNVNANQHKNDYHYKVY